MVIRPAQVEDGPAFVELVQSLADFEKLPPPDAEALRRLQDDAFAQPPRYQLWVAEDPATLGAQIVAYAAWFLTYSTFRARQTLYLEDLFVHPRARRQGVATAMMKALRSEAQERGCARMEWSVLGWNAGAKALYESLDARHLADWQLMRIDL